VIIPSRLVVHVLTGAAVVRLAGYTDKWVNEKKSRPGAGSWWYSPTRN
jgi:hypothetical protein